MKNLNNINLITKNKIIQNGIVSERLKFLLNKLELDNSKIILDIGSWHLEQSIELSLIFPNSKIYAFEPVPESYVNCLERSRYFHNISVFNIALTNFCGQTSFFPIDEKVSPDKNIGASSLFKFKDGLNGSFFNQCWIQKEIKVEAETLDFWAKKNNVPVIGIDNVENCEPLETAKLPSPCAFLFGQEGPGLSDEAIAICEKIYEIKQYGSTRSMNASAAGAIAMFAWGLQHISLK